MRPSFKRAQAKREHLKVALLAERHARGPDGQRMRSPQLARCSRLACARLNEGRSQAPLGWRVCVRVFRVFFLGGGSPYR